MEDYRKEGLQNSDGFYLQTSNLIISRLQVSFRMWYFAFFEKGILISFENE